MAPGTPSLLPITNAAPNTALTVRGSDAAGLPVDIGLVVNILVHLVSPEFVP
jgi:hypothetical protein